jgi:hypothetical protein
LISKLKIKQIRVKYDLMDNSYKMLLFILMNLRTPAIVPLGKVVLRLLGSSCRIAPIRISATFPLMNILTRYSGSFDSMIALPE